MQRKITKRLKEWASSDMRKPLMLYGARQIGKTHSLLEFGQDNFENFIYINFEKDKEAHKFFEASLAPQNIIQEIKIKYKNNFSPSKDLIIFDEVQECPLAITSLKYFCEDLPEARLIAAGSLLGVRGGEASYPVGKVDILRMQSMSFEEFLMACDDPMLYEQWQKIDLSQINSISPSVHSQLWNLFKQYLIIGGMPEVVEAFMKLREEDLSSAFEVSLKMQKRIIDVYLADIAKHCGKTNAMHIQRTLENIPQQLARKPDANSSRFRFKGVVPGLSKYAELVDSIDWLEAAGLIHKVYIVDKAELPLSAYKKENIFKLYLFDLGILRALADIDPVTIMNYDFGTYKGYLAENFVLQELVYATEGEEKFYAWKENTAEIEFIRSINGDLIPIEVKSGWKTKSKSLKSFSDKYNPKYKIIYSGQRLNIDNKNGLYKYPIYLTSLLDQS